MSIPSVHEITQIRGMVADLLVDSATVTRNVVGAEPAPGYRPAANPQVVGTIPCRFPVPITGMILGMMTRAERDVVQRRAGMLVAQDADILEGDIISQVTDLTGRVLNNQPMRVDAVVLRSVHSLIILEEYS